MKPRLLEQKEFVIGQMLTGMGNLCEVTKHLTLYPLHILKHAYHEGIKIRVLTSLEKFKDVSAKVRTSNINCDAWPAPPYGLFVVEEKTVYLRKTTKMTVVHEFAHAVDLALGGNEYMTEQSDEIQRAFARCTNWVTPYAASRIDEYFAESVRAYLNANDEACLWPKATRSRLQSDDPFMYSLITNLMGGQ